MFCFQKKTIILKISAPINNLQGNVNMTVANKNWI